MTERGLTQNLDHDHLVWRYAAEHAYSQRVILPVLFVLALNSFPAIVFTDDQLLESQLVTVIGASAAAWLFFSACGALVNRLVTRFSIARVVIVTVSYALTEVIRFGIIYAYADELIGASSFNFAFNIINAAATGIALLGVLALANTDYSRYRYSYASLVRQTKKVQAALSETRTTTARIRSEIVEFVQQQLSRDLNAAIDLGNEQGEGRSNLVTELFRISDEVVRPLSHELSLVSAEHVDSAVIGKPARVPFGVMMREASIASPFRPVEATILIFLLTAPLALIYSSWVSVALSLGFLGLQFSVALIGRRYVKPHLANWHIVPRILLPAAMFSLPVVLYLALVIGPEFSDANTAPFWFGFGLFLVVLLASLISLSQGLRSARVRSLDALRDVESQLRWLVVRAQSQLWLEQKRLALTLHNEVQGTLLAAALKLRRAIDAGHAQVEQVMPEVQDMIRACIDVQLVSTKFETLQHVIDQLNDSWSALIVMRVDAQPEPLRALERDPLALEIVAELVREFEINSLKHGRATESVIELTTGCENSIRLRLKNNGNAVNETSQIAGLGTQFLQSVSLDFEFTIGESGAQLDVEIPIAVS